MIASQIFYQISSIHHKNLKLLNQTNENIFPNRSKEHKSNSVILPIYTDLMTSMSLPLLPYDSIYSFLFNNI